MLLKELEIEADEFENSGWYLIHAAVKSGNVDVVKFLIECGVDVNRRDLRQKQTSLEISVDEPRWKPAIIRLLLGAGANLTLPGEGGLLPIHFAVQGKKLPAVKILLEHGADPNILFPYPDPFDESQLVSSIRVAGDVALALLAGGADVNTRGSDDIAE